jgi:hypothetical protein
VPTESAATRATLLGIAFPISTNKLVLTGSRNFVRAARELLALQVRQYNRLLLATLLFHADTIGTDQVGSSDILRVAQLNARVGLAQYVG